MATNLSEQYEAIISDFTEQNKIGGGEVNINSLVKEPEFTKEEAPNEGLLSWYYTKTDNTDKLTVHLYSYDRCRVNQVNPDGNRVTVTLEINGEKKSNQYSWLDKY